MNDQIEWKKQKVFGDGKLIEFNEPGDTLVLEVTGIRRGQHTRMGPLDFVEGKSLDTTDAGEPEEVAFILSAGLEAYNWDQLTGKLVKVEFLGREKNPKTGREYKAFEVYTA